MRTAVLVLLCLTVPGRTEEPRVRIALAGDSTVTAQAGWGEGFTSALPKSVEVLNFSVGGRSSKSFRDEGLWKKVLAAKPDYVLIQFGHNDQKTDDPKRGTDPATTFKANLTQFVEDVLAAGAKPVLVTSLSRRDWAADGKIHSTLVPYVEAVKAVAKDRKVPLIDLHARSIELYERLGRAEIDTFSPRKGTEIDNTHLNAKGSTAVGRLVAEELVKAVPTLAVGQRYTFESGEPPAGFTAVAAGQVFDAARGHGFLTASPKDPALFAVSLDEGNYRVTMRFGSATAATSTTVKAETRRLMVERVDTTPGKFETRVFTVNVRRPGVAKLNDREKGPPVTPGWDDLLTLEFNGKKPGVVSVEIVPVTDAVTVFLAGDSTVTDQRHEPFAGWGQMLPRFFGPTVAVSNHAESGLALFSFEGQKRLAKILGMMKPGDYLFIQFGHNDQKDKRAGAGAFTTYKADLKRFVAAARGKGGLPVLVAPMERRRFNDAGQPTPTLADYAAAVRQVGKEEKVPVIDLHAMSLKLYAALGPEKSARAFVHYPAKTFPGRDEALKDNTHHNAYGGYELARCVVEGIKASVPALAKHLAADVGSFDPEKPDSPEKFDLPVSAFGGKTETPAGN
ncbi:rhamnogalacturonan acetylesterase [Limnoglobus roseus]|uniref:CE12 family carbohydrate esterase n=1 Tax=Limnoglobus roseus TaxID=2598579 RepID=A0A5C1AFA3_9BACT|nr:rhamnogalacturonan acetylesterase [Limnoglobus roseus]QEL16402.1 CE12 family carbohydrate esterase [Limnoglobus roseus]